METIGLTTGDKTIEFEGKTLDEAKNKACTHFAVDENQIDIEILENSRKFFNFIGGTKVRIAAKLRGKGGTVEQKAKDILEYIMGYIDENATIEHQGRDQETVFNIVTTKGGLVIGKNGDTLTAIQYILNKILANNGNSDGRKILVDTQGYREKRRNSLITLAMKSKDRVLKTNRSVSLNINNSYERWIIHNYLLEDGMVLTRSVGEGPNRKLVIFPKDERNCKVSPGDEEVTNFDE